MKVSRHAKIIELISQYDIETQEELAKYNYIIGVAGIAFFSVALLEELRMFSQ